MKQSISTIVAIFIVASLTLSSVAAAFTGEAFGMIASVGSGDYDQDIILSRRVDNTISFKYCSATKNDGSQTPVAEYRKARFLKENLETNQPAFQKFKKDLFENNEVCQTIGKPLYGINKYLLDRDQNYIDGNFWNRGGDDYYNWGAWLGGIASGIEIVNTIGALSDSAARQNTTTFMKHLSSNPRLRLHATATMMSLIVLGGSTYLLFDHDHTPEALTNLDSIMQKIITEKAIMSELSMPSLKSNFEKAISIAVKGKALIVL